MSRKNKKFNRLPKEQSDIVGYFETKTETQADLKKSIENNEVTVAIGPAGTGKTYVTMATALKLLGNTYKTIYLVKSLTKMDGEDPGFIKGSLADKMAPVLMSYTWTVDKILGKNRAEDLMKKELMEALPLAFIRGVSIDNALVIVDEAQNLTHHAFKTIMTRIGTDSKYVFLGDVEQIDRKRKQESCLADIYDLFKDSDVIGTVEFGKEDCVRNPIIPLILEKLEEINV